MPLFHTHVVVDWSARSSPSPKRCTKDAIWWAVSRICGGEIIVASPEYERTRHEALDRLARLIADELALRPPGAGGLRLSLRLSGGCRRTSDRPGVGPRALGLVRPHRIEDGPDNDNNRYAVAAAINAAYPGIGPFWGRPARWSYPTIPVRASARSRQESQPPERRIADRHARRAPRPSGSWPMLAPSARRCCWACPRSSAL